VQKEVVIFVVKENLDAMLMLQLHVPIAKL
jgi:hypothetical protein